MDKLMLVVPLRKGAPPGSNNNRWGDHEPATKGVSHHQDAGGNYTIRVRGADVGHAKKTDSGFYYQGLNGDAAEHPTMASLKDSLKESAFQGVQERADAKPLHMTVDNARAFAGISHSQVRGYLKEINQLYPWLKKEQLGITMVMMRFQAQATLPGKEWDYSRKWLKDNEFKLPKLPEVDWKVYNESGYKTVRYLTKPEKT